MQFTPRVTMREVAAEAGFHQTTVSLALRQDRRIAEPTRRHIAAVAERMGYAPHPLVSAYAAACRASRKPSANAGTVLAYLLPGGKKDSGHVAGARAAAQAQGYALETFALGGRNLTPQRLNTILRTRNIHGVIIGAMPEAMGSFELEWDQYCAVAVEYTFSRPELDRAVHDSYSGMLSAIEQCRSHGLRRIGLALTRNGHERTLGLATAAFWKEQKAAGSKIAPIDPLYLDAWDQPAFLKWFERQRPQALISSSALMPQIAATLDARGLKVPGDLALLSLNVLGTSRFSGIDQDFTTIGATATRMVIDKLMRNDRGIPAVRQTVLVPGKWVQGRTFPATIASPTGSPD